MGWVFGWEGRVEMKSLKWDLGEVQVAKKMINMFGKRRNERSKEFLELSKTGLETDCPSKEYRNCNQSNQADKPDAEGGPK